MKKSLYLALAALTLTLFACTSKPASTDEQTETQDTVAIAEQEPAVSDSLAVNSLAVDSLATDSLAVPQDSLAAEQPKDSIDEEFANKPAEELAHEQLAIIDGPDVPSDKFPIARSEGNMIRLNNELVTADANGNLAVSMVMDKIEESKVRLVMAVDADGNRLGVFPVSIEPGGTKINFKIGPEMGRFVGEFTPGKQYLLSFVRATL